MLRGLLLCLFPNSIDIQEVSTLDLHCAQTSEEYIDSLRTCEHEPSSLWEDPRAFLNSFEQLVNFV